MGNSGKTAAAAGAAVPVAILLIPLLARYGVTLTEAEAIALGGVLAPIFHGVMEILGAVKDAILARIARKTATLEKEPVA